MIMGKIIQDIGKKINNKHDEIYIHIEGDRALIIDIESTKIIEYEDDEGFNQYAEPVYLKNELDILYDLIKADLIEKVEG